MNNIFKKLLGEENYDGEYPDGDTNNGEFPRTKPEFVLVKPDKRDDLLMIADHLLNRKTVILNLELVTKEIRRFVDFLSGVAYALNGQIKKVAVHTFLIIPGGVEITGDIFEDIEGEINY